MMTYAANSYGGTADLLVDNLRFLHTTTFRALIRHRLIVGLELIEAGVTSNDVCI